MALSHFWMAMKTSEEELGFGEDVRGGLRMILRAGVFVVVVGSSFREVEIEVVFFKGVSSFFFTTVGFFFMGTFFVTVNFFTGNDFLFTADIFFFTGDFKLDDFNVDGFFFCDVFFITGDLVFGGIL